MRKTHSLQGSTRLFVQFITNFCEENNLYHYTKTYGYKRKEVI